MMYAYEFKKDGPVHMKRIIHILTLFLFSWSMFALDKPSQELSVVPRVDLERYCGTWFEIARLPNRFQDDCEGNVTASYRLDGDEIIVVNRCLKTNGEMIAAEGRARIAKAGGPNSKLEVRFAPAFLSFLPFVWGDYWIMDLAPDYSYAVVGEPDREYLWILARTKTLPEPRLKSLLNGIRQQGYDLKELLYTRHTD